MTVHVLADYHHSDLYESFELTLHDRLGFDVFRPIGLEWFTEGVWQHEKLHHGDAVARQYLQHWDTDTDCGDHWERVDTTHPGRTYRMVTTEQFRAMQWDIVIASVHDNQVGFERIARQKGAKYGVHIGNQGQPVDWDLADFGLVSSFLYERPAKPFVIYRQEFSLTDFRFEWPPAEKDTVSSFVQCFPENAYPYAEFLDLARIVPDLQWKVYGAYGTHPSDEFACGNLPSTPKVAEAMRATRIAYHAKSWSDGFGHVIHNLAAVGRPLIGRASYYADKLAGPLWVEGVTSFDLDSHTTDELVGILRRLRDDDEYHWSISEGMAHRFRDIVDFDQDAENIRLLLESVL